MSRRCDRFTIHLPQIPKGTAQMKRTNRRTGVFFEADSVRNAREIYTWLLRSHKPAQPYEGALRVNVTFAYAIKDKKKRGCVKTSKPDCDNLVKLFLDCMTSVGYWHDDCQISVLTVTKGYSVSDNAYINVYVEELT